MWLPSCGRGRCEDPSHRDEDPLNESWVLGTEGRVHDAGAQGVGRERGGGRPTSQLVATPPMLSRTFVLATIAVQIVIYGLMPQLQTARVRLVTRGA